MVSRDPLYGVRRRAATSALAAELGHELQGPLNLLRLTTDRLRRGEMPDAEDLELLDEELARLARLSARLRLLAQSSAKKANVSVRLVVELALSELSYPISGEVRPTHVRRSVPLEVDVEKTDGALVVADAPLLAQALRELVDNALEARHERAGLSFEPGAGGEMRGFCVWDDGPGFELGVEQSLRWGVTTRAGAAGLGLTLALRVARAHGFRLELRRTTRTEAWLLVPDGVTSSEVLE